MSRMAIKSLIFVAALMVAGVFSSPATVSAQQNCGCATAGECGCNDGVACDEGRRRLLQPLRRLRRPTRSCPECNCEHCTLEVSPTEVSRSCFQVEQKQVCIPAVRLPWMDCCPGKACVRTVNVLTVHKYKCPGCNYTWTVREPEIAPVDCDPCQSGFAPPAHTFNYVEGPATGAGYVPPVYDAGSLPMEPSPVQPAVEVLPPAAGNGG